MRFAIKTKNMELTDAIASAVERRLDTLSKKASGFGDSVGGEVEVGKTTMHHKNGEHYRAEIRIGLPGKSVYAEATHEDLYAAIADAGQDAGRQITEYKDRHDSEKRRGGRPDKE